MAPTVVGKHFQCECTECKFSFGCDIEQAEKREFLVCPNCGFGKINRADETVCERKEEQAVEISIGNRSPNRWELVVFSMVISNDSIGKTGIKRMVGQPGEVISISQGNLYADDILLRKPLDVQKEIRVPVYDSRYLREVANSNHKTRRWSGVDGSSWQIGASSIKLESETNQDKNWASYRQLRCYATKKDAKKIVKVEDNYGFNQSLTRDLNETDELFIETEVECSLGNSVGLRYFCKGTAYEFWISPDDSTVCFSKSSSQSDSDPRFKQFADDLIEGEAFTLELSSFDNRLLLLINGQKVLTQAIDDVQSIDGVQANVGKLTNDDVQGQVTSDVDSRLKAQESDLNDNLQLQIGVSSEQVSFRRVRIWRDLYYLPPVGSDRNLPFVLKAKEGFILLGDNVPLSIDSRHWVDPSVTAEHIIGTVDLPQKR
ncbi:MAG: S26 family signal peptidase [Mariniblastus sp.]